jgi:hypothetical protein
MKRKLSCLGYPVFLMLFILGLSLSSCVTTRADRLAGQRRGFMIMDKSEFSMNKKFKKSKSFKKQQKRSKRLSKKRKRL